MQKACFGGAGGGGGLEGGLTGLRPTQKTSSTTFSGDYQVDLILVWSAPPPLVLLQSRPLVDDLCKGPEGRVCVCCFLCRWVGESRVGVCGNLRMRMRQRRLLPVHEVLRELLVGDAEGFIRVLALPERARTRRRRLLARVARVEGVVGDEADQTLAVVAVRLGRCGSRGRCERVCVW